MKKQLMLAVVAAMFSGVAVADMFDGMNNGAANGNAYGTGNGYGTTNANGYGSGNGNTQGWGRGQGNSDGEVEFVITLKGKGKSNMLSELAGQGNGVYTGYMDGNANSAANGNGYTANNFSGSNNIGGNAYPNTNWGNNAPAAMMPMQATPAANIYPTEAQWQQFLAIQRARQQAFAAIVKRMFDQMNANKPSIKMPAMPKPAQPVAAKKQDVTPKKEEVK